MRQLRNLFLLGAILSGAGSVLLSAFSLESGDKSPEGKWGRSPVTIVHAQTPSGQSIFDQKCKSCHTIGGGRTVGPDLKGITGRRDKEWLIRFVTSPGQVIAQGDPIARQLVQEYGMQMPNLGLSAEEAEAVLAYIATQFEGGQVPASPAPGGVATTGDATTGRELFSGEVALKNGGAACLSCHNISGLGTLGGGTLAKDLTSAHARLGQAGLMSLLKTTPFPAMSAIYSARPLTDAEIGHLVTYLGTTGSSPETKPASNQGAFLIVGIAGALFVVGLFQLLWRGRLSGVRRN
ncbi:MAG: cytochrome c, partial [Dehalococcoidia bacterium]|nr:cytochrome c [Dehalococcoidia bacterium]